LNSGSGDAQRAIVFRIELAAPEAVVAFVELLLLADVLELSVEFAACWLSSPP
jgi:hypothetical protein